MDDEFKIVGKPGNSRVIFKDKGVKEKKIRFITPNYKTLFEIEDGEEIRIIFPDGEDVIEKCEYLDETHLRVGKWVYHICEFAEKMKIAGNEVEPMKKWGGCPEAPNCKICKKENHKEWFRCNYGEEENEC